ncbi:MAG: synthase delta subunit [Symbiobacteriaceae bacterium]|jgi:F-type H+-transporting ATPase subunit delta|nr:synthase delta subunit [Symbiobacteriaceae bacterium]
MLNQAVSRRYAQALFELAQGKGLVDQVDREFGLVIEMINANPKLKSVMNDVLLAPEVKTDLINKLFTGKVSELVHNFLLVVVRKRREAYFPQMYRTFLDLANEARGIVEVEVRSAVALPEETAHTLEQKLVARLGKRVKFQTQVAPELIGGLVVRVGDELMDGSIRTRLRRMRDRLTQSKAQ